MTSAKDAIQGTVDDQSDALIELSHRIHANPELCFEEEKASAWVAGMLSEAGLKRHYKTPEPVKILRPELVKSGKRAESKG